MLIPGHGEFTVIGENVHTTRLVSRKGKLVVDRPDGTQAVRFRDSEGKPRFLTIPDSYKKSQDYDEGRVKHVKIAVPAAMEGSGDALAFIHRTVQRQLEAGVDFLDVNVDEVSVKLDEQLAAMAWLVSEVERVSNVPVSVDSSLSEIIEVGLEA